MTLQNQLTIIIKHQIKGRLRLIFSHPVKDPNQLRNDVTTHPGIEFVQYTHITRSLLIKYDTSKITYQELLVRVATRFSLEHDLTPVLIQTALQKLELGSSAYYSGVSLLVAFLSKFSSIQGSTPHYFQWGAGLATGWAVIEHGWSEYKEKGNFDPEVISFAYLMNSMLRGSVLQAACLTWIASFGRHLIWPTTETVELRPARISQNGTDSPQFELLIKQNEETDNMRILGHLIRTAFGVFLSPQHEQPQTLLGQIQEVSDSHGKVFEGLHDLKVGIPVHIR